MELKWLLIVAGYYFILVLFFLSLPTNVIQDSELNATGVDNINVTFEPDEELGDIGTGIGGSLVRVFVFATVGVNLGTSMPTWFQLPFTLWSVIMTLIAIFTLKNALWKG